MGLYRYLLMIFLTVTLGSGYSQEWLGEDGCYIVLNQGECSACLGFPDIIQEYFESNHSLATKFILPSDEEDYLDDIGDLFDINLSNSNVIVDSQFYARMLNGFSKSRMIIVVEGMIEYYGLMQTGFELIMENKILGTKLNGLNEKFECNGRVNINLNSFVSKCDSTMIFYNSYINKIYRVNRNNNNISGMVLSDDDYLRICAQYYSTMDILFEKEDDIIQSVKKTGSRLYESKSIEEFNNLLYWSVIINIPDAQWSIKPVRFLLKLNCNLDVVDWSWFPEAVEYGDHTYYTNPFLDFFGNTFSVVNDKVILSKMYDPYLLQGDRLTPNRITPNLGEFYWDSKKEMQFRTMKGANLPEARLNSKDNYYSDWTMIVQGDSVQYIYDYTYDVVQSVDGKVMYNLKHFNGLKFAIVTDAWMKNDILYSVGYMKSGDKEYAMLHEYQLNNGVFEAKKLRTVKNGIYNMIGGDLYLSCWTSKKNLELTKMEW